MAFVAFLKIDNIPGESTDDAHRDWIEILSYNMGLSQTASASAGSGGGASAERADFQDFCVVKVLDRASPKLVVACADGTHISEVALELCRAEGDRITYMEYKLTDCIVSSWRNEGYSQEGEAQPLEEVSFNYSKIEWTYTMQKRPDGSGGGNVAVGWDLEKNAKV